MIWTISLWNPVTLGIHFTRSPVKDQPWRTKHKVHVHHAAVATLPENYEERLIELFPGRFKNLRLFVLDPYDIVLSKLSRNLGKDREDVAYLVKTKHLDPKVLRRRYDEELRTNLIGPPERHHATLGFWLQAYFGESEKNTED